MLYEIEIDGTDEDGEGFFTTLHIEAPSVRRERNGNMTAPNSVLAEMFRLARDWAVVHQPYRLTVSLRHDIPRSYGADGTMIGGMLVSLLECTYDRDVVATLRRTESTFLNRYHDKPGGRSVIAPR